MKNKAIKRILLSLFSITLLTTTFIGCSGCSNEENPNEGKDNATYGLVADFENYDEIRKFTFEWYFGAASINTDPQYITNGNGSLKVTDTDKTATVTIPLKNDLAQNDYSDTSKLQEIQLDLYNASEEIYTMNVSLLYKDGLASSEKQTISLEPHQWTNYSWNVDLKQISINANLDEATGFLINFEPNCGKEKIVYVDRLQFYYGKQAAEIFDVTLEEGELCSFEKEYQEFATYSACYGSNTDFLPITSINTETEYVKEGQKSLKVVCPAGVKGKYPYVAFSPKMLEVANLAQYGNDAALSFWVYNTQDKNFLLILDFYRTGATAQRGFHITIKPGWTNVILTFPEINKEDEGVDILTSSLQKFYLCYESFEATDTLKEKVLYFDDFKILQGDEVYADLVKPETNELFELENDSDREAINDNLANYVSINRGEVSISNEEATTIDGYSIKIGNLEELTVANKTWVAIKFNKLALLIEYLQKQDEYADTNVLTFKIKADAYTAICENSGYKVFGATLPRREIRATDGWVKIVCPIKDIVNNELQLNCASTITAIYIDEIKLETQYKITWKHENGDVLAENQVYKGEIPVYDGEIPVKESTNPDKLFRFIGWDKEVVEATRNVTYTAVFEERDFEYIVTFDTDGGTPIEAITVKRGEAFGEMPDVPTKAGSEFSRWSEDLTGKTLTGNVTVVAIWKEVDITDMFTESWIGYYGIYVHPTNYPEYFCRALGSDTYKYTVIDVTKYQGRTLKITLPKTSAWGLTFSTNNDATIKDVEAIEHKWYYCNPDGDEYTSIAIPKVASGNLYVKVSCRRDATTFSAKVLDGYTVTFDTKGGTAIPSQFVYHGEKMVIPANPTHTAGTFERWDTDLTKPITSSLTVTAIYKNVEVDITDQFIWSTDKGGAYTNYANSSAAFGTVYTAQGNYAYSTQYVDISAYVGRTLRITLPDVASFGLLFADETATGVGAKTGTKYEEGWYVNHYDGCGNGEYVDIVIPEGAKYVKTTYYLDTTGKTPFSAKII